MVGDRSDTDVAGAQAVGLDGILVSRPESASAQPGIDWVDPDFRIRSLLDLF
jgi:ribonucleotide monophosphatase NagD (HAD superfamily)